MKFELLLATDPPDGDLGDPPIERLRCPCGRFAKYGGDRHYYNGTFDCYSFDVICARHGVITIECV
jgi:hypothetical protein